MEEISFFELVWQLAAKEAAAAKYREISPGHLMIALARVADPDVSKKQSVSDDSAAQAFAALGIEPRRFRRRMRVLLGDGGVSKNSGVIHRSQACKAVFVRAQALAKAAGTSDRIGYLVEAAFLSLGESITPDNKPSESSSPYDDIPTEL